jgi:FAD synthetase
MTILLFGTFDHFHPGHAFVITEALKRGNVNVVVARDANVEKIKGRRPDYSENERMKEIAAAFPQVTVALGDPDDFLKPVLDAKPDLILLGYDQKFPGSISEEALRDLGIAIERLPGHEPEKHKSSIKRMQKGMV